MHLAVSCVFTQSATTADIRSLGGIGPFLTPIRDSATTSRLWEGTDDGRGTLAGHFNATCPKLPSRDEYAELIREGGLG